jgi:hypothetical protein
MVAIFVMMLAGGIGLVQAICDPVAVTLRWLRLGGIIGLCLMAIAGVIAWKTHMRVEAVAAWHFVAAVVAVMAQLITCQKAMRKTQRVMAGVAFIAAWGACAWAMAETPLPGLAGGGGGFSIESIGGSSDSARVPTIGLTPGVIAATGLSSGVLGGYLMAMLLGHAYLTAGNEMTQAPFRRLVIAMGVLLLLRTIASGIFGCWPYFTADDLSRYGGGSSGERMWNVIMISARLLVGVLVPAVFTWMTYDCVQRRSNQSATGILYVASVLIILGEGTAIALLGATGLVF